MLDNPRIDQTRIHSFCESVALYPPAQLFGGNSSPSAKEKKAEQRIMSICEELYSLSSSPLHELRNAMREAVICESFHKNIKPEYVINVYGVLQAHLLHCHKIYAGMCKKDPILVEYFKNFSLDKEEINNFLFGFLKEKLEDSDLEPSEIAKMMTKSIVDTTNKIKGKDLTK